MNLAVRQWPTARDTEPNCESSLIENIVRRTARRLMKVDHRVTAGDIFAGQRIDAGPLAKALVLG